MLRSQLDFLSEPETNPFECDESTTPDIEEVYPAMQLLDSDHEGDSDHRAEWLDIINYS